MNHPNRNRAFSLAEVIIAAGLFAVSVTVVLALLPALARQGGEATDSQSACGLPDALRAELTRIGATGFDALAAQVPVLSGATGDGMKFAANRGATRLHSLDYQPPASGPLPVGEQYFLVECWRFPDEPLQFAAGKGFLAVMVRVSWPYRLPGTSAPAPVASRHEMLFTVALNR
ncbi:MAG: hypothetical protein QG602_940 [Verrucomicrobiota bacterium]|nr:hypothetical protein [Verrucomicrobiota bacterium]